MLVDFRLRYVLVVGHSLLGLFFWAVCGWVLFLLVIMSGLVGGCSVLVCYCVYVG